MPRTTSQPTAHRVLMQLPSQWAVSQSGLPQQDLYLHHLFQGKKILTRRVEDKQPSVVTALAILPARTATISRIFPNLTRIPIRKHLPASNQTIRSTTLSFLLSNCKFLVEACVGFSNTFPMCHFENRHENVEWGRGDTQWM